MSNASFLVSIVIPCYNQSHFLTDAVQSALQQTHRNLEIIIIDDASTDDIAPVVQPFKSAHFPTISVLKMKKNIGLCRARNLGLRKSRGEYVLFLDADDRLKPQAVEVLLRELRKCNNCAFSFGQMELIDRQGELLRDWPYGNIFPPFVETDFYARMLHRNFIWPPASVLFRRAPLMQIGGFNTRYVTREDFELYLRVLRRYSPVPVREILVQYRRHEANKTNTYRDPLLTLLAIHCSQLPYVATRKHLWKIWVSSLLEMLRRVKRRFF